MYSKILFTGFISVLLLTSCGNNAKNEKENADSAKQLYLIETGSSYGNDSGESFYFSAGRLSQDLYEFRGRIGDSLSADTVISSWGNVTSERLDKILDSINISESDKYEPVQTETDGEMVNEYQKNTVFVSYQLYDENGNVIVSDESDDALNNSMSGFYALSDEDYKSLYDEFAEIHYEFINQQNN